MALEINDKTSNDREGLAVVDNDASIVSDDDDCKNRADNDEKAGQQTNKVDDVHQFYFVKINIDSYVDPDIPLKIEKIKEERERLEGERKLVLDTKQFFTDIPLFKVLMYPEYIEALELDSPWRYSICSYLRKTLERYWPECIDEDPEEVIYPSEEIPIMKNRLRLLMDLLSRHGYYNRAEEKRMLKEAEQLQQRIDQLIKADNEAQARCTIVTKKHDYRHFGTNKYKVQLAIRSWSREIKEEFNRKKAARLSGLEDSLKFVNTNIKLEEANLSAMQRKLGRQACNYDKYVEIRNKAEELAKKKDIVALQELSSKQVGEFMSEWNSVDKFRANYKRSIAQSLKDRGLTSEGRQMQLEQDT